MLSRCCQRDRCLCRSQQQCHATGSSSQTCASAVPGDGRQAAIAVSPAVAVCLNPQVMSAVGCSVFRPILKESYLQDPSDGSSRLSFELRKNEAQNLCRAFDKAGNIQVASTLSRIADSATLGGLAWCGIPGLLPWMVLQNRAQAHVRPSVCSLYWEQAKLGFCPSSSTLCTAV